MKKQMIMRIPENPIHIFFSVTSYIVLFPLLRIISVLTSYSINCFASFCTIYKWGHTIYIKKERSLDTLRTTEHMERQPMMTCSSIVIHYSLGLGIGDLILEMSVAWRKIGLEQDEQFIQAPWLHSHVLWVSPFVLSLCSPCYCLCVILFPETPGPEKKKINHQAIIRHIYPFPWPSTPVFEFLHSLSQSLVAESQSPRVWPTPDAMIRLDF